MADVRPSEVAVSRSSVECTHQDECPFLLFLPPLALTSIVIPQNRDVRKHMRLCGGMDEEKRCSAGRS